MFVTLMLVLLPLPDALALLTTPKHKPERSSFTKTILETATCASVVDVDIARGAQATSMIATRRTKNIFRIFGTFQMNSTMDTKVVYNIYYFLSIAV
jgi:hypothetical protein